VNRFSPPAIAATMRAFALILFTRPGLLLIMTWNFPLRILLFSLTFIVSASHAAPMIIPSPPQISAKAYLLMDAATGDILIEENADQQLPPASLTKMLTSYIVSEEISRGKLQETDTVLVSEDAWRRGGTTSGGSTMFLKVGSRVPVLDLLKGVIIQSGNDASIALAEHLAGSERAFADVMNQYAQLLGMRSSHFVNATGWPAEGHTTTARDLAILARAVINDHPDHYPLYAEKYFSYNGINQPNRNLLLHRDPTVDGLKTGHTEEAGYCLVASAKRQDMRLISVVMGTRSEAVRAEESAKLLAYGFRFFQTHSLYKKDQELSRARVWKGAANEVSLGVDKDVAITIPRGSSEALKAEIVVDSTIVAPLTVGQALGELRVSLEDKVIYKSPLVVLTAVEEAGFFARLWDSLVLFVTGIFA
jgi:D-alanyl-D-alanine carboxypeptidase (penicillin-binding protein 5/6)